jgi:hypothetical protein
LTASPLRSGTSQVPPPSTRALSGSDATNSTTSSADAGRWYVNLRGIRLSLLRAPFEWPRAHAAASTASRGCARHGAHDQPRFVEGQFHGGFAGLGSPCATVGGQTIVIM